jgi:RNA polymerase sigma-70 factor (ECF subfamily)
MGNRTTAFQSLHDEVRPRVLRYLTRLVGAGEAEDLTQSVMLKVSAGLPDFRGNSTLFTWIYRIATNAAYDALRRKGLPAPPEAEDDDERNFRPEAQTPSAEATAMRDEMDACIRDLIERLPEHYRTVIVLSEVEGFKNAEIAAILGISVDAVKIRLHRARDQLRNALSTGCTFDRNDEGELACDRKSSAAVTFHPRR